MYIHCVLLLRLVIFLLFFISVQAKKNNPRLTCLIPGGTKTNEKEASWPPDTGQNQEVMMNNRRLLQLQWRQCEGVESAGGKPGLSADALSDTLPFGVKFFVCFEAKRNHDSKLT